MPAPVPEPSPHSQQPSPGAPCAGSTQPWLFAHGAGPPAPLALPASPCLLWFQEKRSPAGPLGREERPLGVCGTQGHYCWLPSAPQSAEALICAAVFDLNKLCMCCHEAKGKPLVRAPLLAWGRLWAALLCTPNPPPAGALARCWPPPSSNACPGTGCSSMRRGVPTPSPSPVCDPKQTGGLQGPEPPMCPPAAVYGRAQKAGSLSPAVSQTAQRCAAASERGEALHPRAALQQGVQQHRLCAPCRGQRLWDRPWGRGSLSWESCGVWESGEERLWDLLTPTQSAHLSCTDRSLKKALLCFLYFSAFP